METIEAVQQELLTVRMNWLKTANDFSDLQQENERLKEEIKQSVAETEAADALSMRKTAEADSLWHRAIKAEADRDRLAVQLAEAHGELLHYKKSSINSLNEAAKFEQQLAASERKVGEFIEAVKKRAVVLDLGRDGRSDWCQAEAFKDVSKAYLAGRTEEGKKP